MKKKRKEIEETSYNKAVTTLNQDINYNLMTIRSIPEFQNNTVINDIQDTKSIQKVENLIRSSYEYSRYTQYLKNDLDMNQCSYFKNIESGNNIKIELHHSPFTLFDITQIVISKHILEQGFALEFDVANEVMLLHYQNLVGLIPLSPTVHELVHNFLINIHPKNVYGEWEEFVKLYIDYFPDDINIKYDTIQELCNNKNNIIPEILNKKYTYLDIEGIPCVVDNTNKTQLLDYFNQNI